MWRIKWVSALCGLALACGGVSRATERDYHFQGSISREVLGNYLSRAITMNGLSYSDTPEDDDRMIKKLGAKFVSRVSHLWNAHTDFPSYDGKLVEEADWFQRAETASKRLHGIETQGLLRVYLFP